jgi:hypothetical protein
MFCLNDIYEVSASGINFEINQNNERLAGGKKLPDNFTESLRKIAVIEKLNLFLRSNSKLYLILKGMFTDPELRYFYAEYLEYQTASVNNLEKIAELSRMFDEAGSSFYVFIAPYQHQIKVLHGEREPDKRYGNVTMPEKITNKKLIEKGVKVHDLTKYFVENNNNTQSLFVPFDPMHFSDEGHRMVAEYFERNVFLSRFMN